MNENRGNNWEGISELQATAESIRMNHRLRPGGNELSLQNLLYPCLEGSVNEISHCEITFQSKKMNCVNEYFALSPILSLL